MPAPTDHQIRLLIAKARAKQNADALVERAQAIPSEPISPAIGYEKLKAEAQAKAKARNEALRSAARAIVSSKLKANA